MSITPDEISHVGLRRAWLHGYGRKDVNELLDEIADSFEAVWRERGDLSVRVEALEAELAKHHELETLLRSTLISAERTAQKMKAQARREADLIVQEAHAENRRLTREAVAGKRRLEEGVIKIRAGLLAAFGVLGEWPPSGSATKREEAAQSTEPVPLGEALESGIRNVVG